MKILLVDDEAVSLRLMEKYVARLGHEPVSGLGGREGLRLWQKTRARIVVTDWSMPEVDGLQLCREIRSVATELYTYIIVVSARDSGRDLIAGLESGADDYLVKPVAFDELRARLEIGRRIIDLQTELSGKYRFIQDNFFQTIRMFSNLIETVDENLGGHCRRVGTLCAAVARKHPSVAPDQVRLAETAGLLHDVGMVGLPGQILSKKPLAMNTEEKQLYLAHPEQGEIILREIDMLDEVSTFVRAHHEHYNGRGFPDERSGEDIPLLARIIAGADTYDNLIRRDGVALEDVSEQLVVQRGFQLDPEIVDMLFEINTEQIRQEAQKKHVSVKVGNLAEGMLLVKNVRRPNGVLVMPAPLQLDSYKIERLQKYFRMHAISGEVFIEKRSSRS